jgi:epoxyqueuosine reductase
VGASRFDFYGDFAPSAADDAFPPLRELLELDDEAFRERFQGRAIMRAKRDGLVRNACVALGNVGTAEDLPSLERPLQDRSVLVRGHAAWAVGRLATRHGLREAGKDMLEKALSLEQDEPVREEIRHALEDLA